MHSSEEALTSAEPLLRIT